LFALLFTFFVFHCCWHWEDRWFDSVHSLSHEWHPGRRSSL
jgi:hypothetical protein